MWSRRDVTDGRRHYDGGDLVWYTRRALARTIGTWIELGPVDR